MHSALLHTSVLSRGKAFDIMSRTAINATILCFW